MADRLVSAADPNRRFATWGQAQAGCSRDNLPVVLNARPMSVADIRAFDRRAAEQLRLPTLVLMENAGANAAAWIAAGLAVGPVESLAAARIVILCGAGNNGGDGFVVARHLTLRGARPMVILAVPHDRIAGDARTNLVVWDWIGGAILHGGEPSELDNALREISKADVIVDALLGTGASGPPRGPMAHFIGAANQRKNVWRVAIDLPSGLGADDGVAADVCFLADLTLTLLAPKLGFARVQEYVGELVTLPIGVGMHEKSVPTDE